MTIKEGLGKTYFWIKGEIEKEGANAANNYSKSEIVQQVDNLLMHLGQEEPVSGGVATNGH